MFRIMAVVALMALAGCVLPGGTDGNVGPNAILCEEGPGTFVKAQHHPGFITPDHQYMFYTLERNGVLTYFRANESGPGGSGTLRPQPGALHNVTLTQVQTQMRAHGVWRNDRDYQVTVAWRDDTAEERFAAFCSVVLDDFYDYEARYELNNVADCDGFTFTIDTARGTHSSYSYCQAGPQDVRDSFQDMVEDARRRLGIEGI